jgi:hypothetical protein
MRNDYIRENLDVFIIKDKTGSYRESWLQHTERMPEEKIMRKIFNYHLQGRTVSDHPQKQWIEARISS